MSFSYSISNVWDVDQRWNGLSELGKNHCVPAAWVNWMYYFAMNGRLTALPFVNGQANHIRKNIDAMGDYMDTDGDSGTSASNTIDGLSDWGDDRNLPYFIMTARATDNDNIRYVSLRNLLQMGAHIVVSRGKYKLDDGVFERYRGHALTVVGLTRTDDNIITISVHNPWNDSSLTTQASTNVQHQVLTQKKRNIEGDTVTILRWGPESVNPPYLCIDAWTAILPMFAVSNVAANAITLHSADIATGKVSERKFPLPFNDTISELTLDPSAPFASVIAQASGELWTLSLADGTWVKTPGITGAQRLVYGGRRQRLFVVKDRAITAIDDEGKLGASRDAEVAFDALSYDPSGNRLVGVAGGKLVLIDPADLKVLATVDAPEIPGSGRLSLSVNRRDQSIVLSRQGSPEVVTARWQTKGVVTSRRFRLQTEGASSGAHVNQNGRLFVAENGRFATFDRDGARVKGSVFDGLAVGALLKVARSNNPLDPERSKRLGWRN